MAEVPKDRRYTMSPEWKQAYNKLMKVYTDWELAEVAKDVRRNNLQGKEREEYIQRTKDRIRQDRERYKTASTKELKKLYRDWHMPSDHDSAKI